MHNRRRMSAVAQRKRLMREHNRKLISRRQEFFLQNQVADATN